MPKNSALPCLAAVFRRRNGFTPPSRSLSDSSSESVEASTVPYILDGPLFAPSSTPSCASQPWHYVFHDGNMAWALGGNGRWRLVTVIGDGFVEEIDNRKQIAYNATWTSDGVTMRGTFAPGCGDIKPNTPAIRRLLLDEEIRRVEERDRKELLNDDGDREVKAAEVETSESDNRVQIEL
ncbi:hypothetical protein BJV74DRAFT_131215 [Russula compacta]|nr:hypothetical protein BJV74DRAFT_131215 [Russula compacta]